MPPAYGDGGAARRPERTHAELPSAPGLRRHRRDLHHGGAGGGGPVPGRGRGRASVVAGAHREPAPPRSRPCRGGARRGDVHPGRPGAQDPPVRGMPPHRRSLHSPPRHGHCRAERLSRDREPQPARPSACDGCGLSEAHRGDELRARPRRRARAGDARRGGHRAGRRLADIEDPHMLLPRQSRPQGGERAGGPRLPPAGGTDAADGCAGGRPHLPPRPAGRCPPQPDADDRRDRRDRLCRPAAGRGGSEAGAAPVRRGGMAGDRREPALDRGDRRRDPAAPRPPGALGPARRGWGI